MNDRAELPPTTYRFTCPCGESWEASGRPMMPCPNCTRQILSGDFMQPSPEKQKAADPEARGQMDD